MFRGVKSRPSWFYRVQDLMRDRYRRGESNLYDDDEPRPEDYDEDLSSVSTFSCASRNGCDYGTDDICEYHMKLDTEGPDSDKELDENDPDDIEYREMKMDRRERKRELRTQKKWEEEMRKKREKYREQVNEESREERRKEPQKIKVSEDAEKVGHAREQHKNEMGSRKTYEEAATKDYVGLTIRYIDEVRDALDRAQSLEETPTPLNFGLTKTFKLWSFDHNKHFPEVTPEMYIKFSSRFDGGKLNEEQNRTLRAKKLSGYLYLLWNAAFDLDDFTPPKSCSTKAHNFGTRQEPIYIQFFHDNYLTLKISREFVYADFDDDDIPYNAPSLFTYYGISEKDMVDKEQQEEEEWDTDGGSVTETEEESVAE
ncbi:hypothetical protein FPANT_4079 [Fusarium pseudoanthophilum]|uniref:Uncharacterized protein n=1 Tax=Fusarium pseudoanthophilum TaxID=48495 RepID=A0A8H5US55_9HYPO|nr:hypothetical protein FPANT_4079 [Fusarium pseudoanthophilum]